MYIRLQSNWISSSLSPKLLFFYIHVYTNGAQFVLPSILQDISWGSPLLLSTQTEHPPFSTVWVFRTCPVGPNTFADIAFVNATDTNHLQVISPGRELNSYISPEVAVWKCSYFLLLLFYILLIFLMFSSYFSYCPLIDSKNSRVGFIARTQDCELFGLH